MNVAPGGTDKTCCFYLPIICLIPTAASCVAVPSPSLSSRQCSICYCTYCRSDRVASKDDLIVSIWGGRIVSDTTLTSRIKSARNAVGDRFLSDSPKAAIGGLLRSSVRHRAWAHPRGGAAAYGPKSRRLSNTSAPCAHNRTHPSPAYPRWIASSISPDLICGREPSLNLVVAQEAMRVGRRRATVRVLTLLCRIGPTGEPIACWRSQRVAPASA
jgi:hypothetical protein